MGVLRWAVVLTLVALAASPGAALSSAAGQRSEELVYRWQLEGASGLLARLLGLVPTSGDGVMKLRFDGAGRLEVQFTATSERAEPDEHWTYQTVVDTGSWRTLEVRDSLRYGKKHRIKTFDLRDVEVIDVLSGLQRLRHAWPVGVERHTLWSEGKIYPVTVTLSGVETRELEGGAMTVRRLSIRGVREPGQRLWRSRAELWLTDDEAALPVEMVYHQALGRVRMTLVGAGR